MKMIKRTVFEVLVLGVAGLVVGFGYNAVRAKGSIKPFKNYFDQGPAVIPAPSAEPPSAQPADELVGKTETPAHPKHPYQEISGDEVLALLNHPDTQMGLNVFVDARKQDIYDEGHIPGAVRCDPYEPELCIDDVLNVALAADKVVVYCGGGECEDSVFMCRELAAAGIEHEALFLYAGGWTEWSAEGKPVERSTGD